MKADIPRSGNETARQETKELPTIMIHNSGTAMLDKDKWPRASWWLQKERFYEVLNDGFVDRDSIALWHVESSSNRKTNTAQSHANVKF